MNRILDRIKFMLMKMGFKEITITNAYRSEINYVKDNLYCIPVYLNSLGFLIEYATSYEEAKNHGHEDGDVFPFSLGETVILKGLENEVRRNLIG